MPIKHCSCSLPLTDSFDCWNGQDDEPASAASTAAATGAAAAATLAKLKYVSSGAHQQVVAPSAQSASKKKSNNNSNNSKKRVSSSSSLENMSSLEVAAARLSPRLDKKSQLKKSQPEVSKQSSVDLANGGKSTFSKSWYTQGAPPGSSPAQHQQQFAGLKDQPTAPQTTRTLVKTLFRNGFLNMHSMTSGPDADELRARETYCNQWVLASGGGHANAANLESLYAAAAAAAAGGKMAASLSTNNLQVVATTMAPNRNSFSSLATYQRQRTSELTPDESPPVAVATVVAPKTVTSQVIDDNLLKKSEEEQQRSYLTSRSRRAPPPTARSRSARRAKQWPPLARSWWAPACRAADTATARPVAPRLPARRARSPARWTRRALARSER